MQQKKKKNYLRKLKQIFLNLKIKLSNKANPELKAKNQRIKKKKIFENSKHHSISFVSSFSLLNLV